MDNDADELLGARLDDALRSGLDTDQVDVPTLLNGSRRRAHRLRTQRLAALGTAAALVVATPVAYEVINAGPGDAPPPAVMLPSSSGSAGSRTQPPVPRSVPTAAVPQAPVPTPTSGEPSASTRTNPTSIPDTFAFTSTELPAGLVLARSDPDAEQVLVAGQDCTSPTAKNAQVTRPTVGRQWVWSAGGDASAAATVTLTVTGWPEGQARTAFKAAIGETGFCRWSQPQTPHPLADPATGQRWAATSTEADLTYGRALIQTGDKIVGIEVADPAGAAATTRLLDSLVTTQTTRLARQPNP